MAPQEPLDLLVASSGGHLKQLTRLRRRLPGRAPVVWATPLTAQGSSLLEDQDVVWLPYASPRDPVGTAKAARALLAGLRGRTVSRVVTTGASPALSALPAALLGRAPVHYIESAARVLAPSTTGRIMARLPLVHCYNQYEGWARGRWSYAGSVFDDFVAASPHAPSAPRSVVVTVGVNADYSFARLVRALLEVLPPEADVLWQLGERDAALLPPGSRVRTAIPALELSRAMQDADLVVCHAGVGSALTALEAGRLPVLVPRRARHDEHVDDHQLQIVDELTRRGLAVGAAVEDITPELLRRPVGAGVEDRTGPPLRLVGEAP